MKRILEILENNYFKLVIDIMFNVVVIGLLSIFYAECVNASITTFSWLFIFVIFAFSTNSIGTSFDAFRYRAEKSKSKLITKN
tara:strand:- start:592 stop:840 length:249 start_codon:yes stop_codon:yes gene_type:complete